MVITLRFVSEPSTLAVLHKSVVLLLPSSKSHVANFKRNFLTYFNPVRYFAFKRHGIVLQLLILRLPKLQLHFFPLLLQFASVFDTTTVVSPERYEGPGTASRGLGYNVAIWINLFR